MIDLLADPSKLIKLQCRTCKNVNWDGSKAVCLYENVTDCWMG